MLPIRVHPWFNCIVLLSDKRDGEISGERRDEGAVARRMYPSLPSVHALCTSLKVWFVRNAADFVTGLLSEWRSSLVGCNLSFAQLRWHDWR